MNAHEKTQQIIQHVAESPLTSKGVVALGLGSGAGGFLQVVPSIISVVGSIVAIIVGLYLIKRHHASTKLDYMKAEESELTQEKTRLENELLRQRLKRFEPGDDE